MKNWITDRLKPIPIPDIARMAEQTWQVEVEGYFEALDTLTPITARLSVKHQGTFLTASVAAETIVTLTCDRCLGQYNHRLNIDTQELIWLTQLDSDNLPLELLSEWDEATDLVESLPAHGQFDLAQWLYEQLCLGLPSQQRCDGQCPGVEAIADPEVLTPEPALDHRWAALAQLQQQLSSSTK